MAQNDAPFDAEAPEVIEVTKEIVSCDGGGGALGHPKVWLNMRGRGWVECGYCDRRFVLRGFAPATPAFAPTQPAA